MKKFLVLMILAAWIGFLSYLGYRKVDCFLNEVRIDIYSDIQKDTQRTLQVHVDSLNKQLEVIKTQLDQKIDEAIQKRSQP